MAVNDGGARMPIQLSLVPESDSDPAASRVPNDPAEDTAPLADTASFADDGARYRDPTLLVADGAGSTFTGVAVSHPEVDQHGPYDSGFDTGGADGGGE